jgi:peroxiredoxin
MTQRLTPGDLAPDFTLPTPDGEELAFTSLRGHKVVIYFYPAAGTPGCTAQACDFRDNMASLSAAGYTVLGVSPDAPEDLQRFRDEQTLPFPLLADRDHAVHEAYGAWGEKPVDGRRAVGTIRSTFVVDEDGRIVHVLYDVPARGHVEHLRRLLDGAPQAHVPDR